MLSYGLILAAYMIGVFYLQKLNRFSYWTEKKYRYAASLLLYAVSFVIPVILLSDSLLSVFVYLVAVIATHTVYFIGQESPASTGSGNVAAFVFAHGLNIAVLLLVVYFFFAENAAFEYVTDHLWSLFGDRADIYIYFMLSALICLQPSSELIRRIMDHFCPHDITKSTDDQRTETALGSTIGVIERIMILMTGFMGWYVAIAFIITAKSIARFKQFEDPDFVERFIIGTFCSVLVPIALLFIMAQLF